MRTGAALRQWLEELIAEMPPGAKLPTDSDFAARCQVSTRTLRRAMAELKNRGLVTRAPGKGTFRAGPESPAPSAPTPTRQSSVETLVAALRQSINRGDLRRGSQLPLNKYISHQYQVSGRTVAAAYRALESEGMVRRIGKHYWVGQFNPASKTKTKNDIFVAVQTRAQLKGLFVDYPIATAYRRLESELTACGSRLHFVTNDQLADATAGWVRRDRYPRGILLADSFGHHIDAVMPFLKPMMRRGRRGARVTVVADMISQPQRDAFASGLVGTVRGNFATAQARAIGKYLSRMPDRDVVFVADGHRLMADPRMATMRYQKHTYEILRQRCGPGGRILEAIVGGPPKLTKKWLLEEALGGEGDYQDYLKSKYRDVPGTRNGGQEEHLSLYDSVEQVVKAYGSDAVWLLVHDSVAEQALDALHKRNARIPESVSVISLENDPHYLHLGLSSCAPDWDLVGYLLAHALLGDMQLERTSRGFIRVASPVVDRQTTPH